MGQSRLFTVVLMLAVGSIAVATGDEKPFNQEEWNRRFQELMHPKPADPKLEAIEIAKNTKENECWKHFIEKNATPSSNANDLTEMACQACDKDIVAHGIATYNADRIKMPLTANRDHSIKSSRDFCRQFVWVDAVEVISDKKMELEKARKDAIKVQYSTKINSATGCSL
jgi:hypothetical protein